jgi:hypothetical protein
MPTVRRRIGLSYSSGRTYSNGRIHPNESYQPRYIYHRNINISDAFKDFLYSRYESYNSTACYYFKSFLLRELDSDLMGKIDNEVFSKITSISESDDGYISINNNQKIKIGKLIVKVGDAIEVNMENKSEATGIEKFVDEYKSWFKIISSLKFKVLKGKDILDGYDRSNHAKNRGMLCGSCMNDKLYLLDLYTNNQEKVELLTLVDDKDKIYGRAFLWKLDNRPFVFMDRVYGVDNYVTKIFNQYAKDSKMAYREQQQTYNFELYLPNGEVTYSKRFPLKVKLKTKNIRHLPYMDSLYIWNKWGNIFSTGKTESFMKFYGLKSTCGSKGKPGLKILGIKIKNED